MLASLSFHCFLFLLGNMATTSLLVGVSRNEYILVSLVGQSDLLYHKYRHNDHNVEETCLHSSKIECVQK